MESVSSSSPNGSVSSMAGQSTARSKQGSSRVCNQTTRVSQIENSIGISGSKKCSRSMEERRDDSAVTLRPMWTQHASTKGFINNRTRYPARSHHYQTPRGRPPPPQWYQAPHSIPWQYFGNPHRRSYGPHQRASTSWNSHRPVFEYGQTSKPHSSDSIRPSEYRRGVQIQRHATKIHHQPRVVVPHNIHVPKEISPSNTTESSTELSIEKRSNSDVSNQSVSPPIKRIKSIGQSEQFNKLDLLCSATLELGPLQENPTGCSCPKSKCIALYCDCFKAGRRCDPVKCSCLNCKNTLEESGPNGARSKAIQGILARNPRAFTNPGHSNTMNKSAAGDQGCNCLRSRCLKLYCTCFQKGKACDPLICSCINCLNLEDDSSGMRKLAIKMTLEKRPDAFKQKNRTKILGAGCACKNNQCIRKYCECFRTGLKCTRKCSCKNCKNR